MTKPQKLSELHQQLDAASQLPPNYSITNIDLELLSFADLSSLKQQISNELYRLGQLLKDQGVDMNTPLLTNDNYPRADIDILTIRILRQKIIMLRNDFDEVMRSLEIALVKQFEQQNGANKNEKADNPLSLAALRVSEPSSSSVASQQQPFIVVKDVLPLSPAWQAQLQINDKITQFHDLTYESTKNITSKNGKVIQIGKVANELRNTDVKLQVLRYDSSSKEYQNLDLTLVPHSDWGGLGLLGCKLVQL